MLLRLFAAATSMAVSDQVDQDLLRNNCTNHIDPSGCRANGDITSGPWGLGIPVDPALSAGEQAAFCGSLCCNVTACEAWAVHANYTAKWAKNCSGQAHPRGTDCCLLKHSGWHMGGPAADCVSGGRSAAPTPPTPPAPTPAAPTPAPAPLPHGGGQCTSDWDCSLGGECERSTCRCDAQFTGAHCGVAHLRRTKINNGIQANSTAAHTWGGHAVRDPARAGKWVGFFSYMAGGCNLNTWQSNSMIISAVADAPDGPYDQEMAPVTGPWTHNAMISQHPNGSYFLFHIGSGEPKPSRRVANCSGAKDGFYPFSPEPPPATTHVADSVHGPWRAAPGVPSVNNPCPFFFENGTTLLYSRTQVKWAPAVDSEHWQTATTVAANGSMKPEDPGVFRDARGNFHMLFNANSGHKHCGAGVPCGGHSWSRDGISWSPPTIPAFGTTVHYQDGSTVNWDYVERPQIVQDSKGVPLTLFISQSYASAHSLAIMFCQDGDTDCVTTIE